MRPRDAIRYLAFELDTLSYVRSTNDDLDRESPGHDVASFIETYNEAATAVGAPTLAPRSLRRTALVSLANPMVAFAAYGIVRHVWNGASDVRVPGIAIGNVRWLPLARYQLAPYGPEVAVTNQLTGARWPTRVEVRVGRAPAARPWGVGVERQRIAVWRSWRFDAAMEFWRQPEVAARAERITSRARTGLEIRTRAERPLIPTWFSTRRLSVIVDVAAKTSGFVPGQPLARGVSLRLGVGIPFD
jgi:hypothetical protein